MSNTFNLLFDFISEFFGNPNEIPENGLKRNKEIWQTLKTIRNIEAESRRPTIEELLLLYPTIYTAVQWRDLKNNEKYIDFLGKCKERVKNYNGTIFELDIISRACLSGWVTEFVEDTTKPDKMIDFIFINENTKKRTAVEIFSKKNSIESLTSNKINNQIKKRSKKFKSEFFKNLNDKYQLDNKILIADITTKTFDRPELLTQYKDIKLSSVIDDIIFTWINLTENSGTYSILPEYFSLRDLDKKYFSLTYAVEILPGPIIFFRKFIRPEPTAIIGQEIKM